MKRVVADRVEDGPEPGAPGAHDALVHLVASPIHRGDLRAFEGVGRVASVGHLVKHIKPGDLTPIFSDHGVWQERLLLPAEQLVALPPTGDALQYAMGFLNPSTALLLLREIVPLQLGEWVIQNAANSSVGQYLIQLAGRQGIRTINVVRRGGLEDHLHRLGGDVVLVDGPELPRQVRQAIGGAPLRLALDAVSGDAAARLAECLSPSGVLCNYGALSGSEGAGRTFSIRTAAGFKDDAGKAKTFGELIPLVATGTLRGLVEATYPLQQVAEALAHAAREHRRGKILLTAAK